MTMVHPISVSVHGEEVICKPKSVTVRNGDKVQWTSSDEILVDFRDRNPFEEPGPFAEGQIATVSGAAEEDTYIPTITVVSQGTKAEKVTGDVKVERPK